MGYKIIYGQMRREDSFFRRQIMTSAIFLLTCLIIHFLWPAGREALRYCLLPQENTSYTQWLELVYGT